jgi:transcriptional regulator NrdR family protein
LVTQVRKRDGSTETFDPDKMKRAMQKAAIDATYSLEGAMDLTLIDEISEDISKEVKEEDEIESTTIREKILSKLEEVESSIFESWKKFDRKYKR